MQKTDGIILGMILRALLFGVAILFALVPASAMATTTPATTTPSSPRPTCTLRASQSAVELGKTVNLSWQSQYATQGFITSIGTVGTAGTQGVIPTGRGTTYVGTFTGPGGTGNCSITISVIQPSGGGIGDVGTVPEPDKLPPSQSAGAPPTLPPANDITLDKTPSKGLIPCGDTTGLTPGTPAYYAAATNCQACHLASLAQRIINFLLGLSIPLAAVMFAYAGVIYFSSGVETSINKIDKAHAIFKSVGIGFMIVLAAWLGINTILHTILDPKQFPEGSWFTIKCVTAANNALGGRVMDTTINQLLSVLPGLNTTPQAPGAPAISVGQSSVYGCPSGWELVSEYAQCINPDDRSQVIDARQTGSTYFNIFNGDIDAAINGYTGADTSSGPQAGNKACAWAVNNVLAGAGVPSIDGDSVALMEQALKDNRGTYVSDLSDAKRGDIIVWKGVNPQGKEVSHVGMCNDDECTKTISNSSGKAKFNNEGGQTFLGVLGRVYRVNK